MTNEQPKWKKGTRVRIRAGWDEAGKTGTVLGLCVMLGQWWTPILWDNGDNDPDWFKAAGLEPIEEEGR